MHLDYPPRPELWRGHGGGLLICLEEILAILPLLLTVKGVGGLLTSTEDIVGRCKEYFEDLLNPADTFHRES